jgi:hypothetical protein
MTLPPFAKVLFDPAVLDYVGDLPYEIADCLYGAFDDIRNRKLSLDPPGGRQRPFLAWACQHIIYASVHSDSNTVVILAALLDDDPDLL